MKRIATILLLALLLGACGRNEQSIPAFITIPAVVLDRGNDEVWNHKDAGFFTYDIDAVSIRFYVEGDTAWTELGVFQLPCRVPVLREGVIDTMVIDPVVKMNGIASTRISYPYYRPISLGQITLTPDETLNLDTLHTTFRSSLVFSVPWDEYFTPTTNLKLDTVVRLITNRDTVLTGTGCGAVRVSKDQKSVSFWSHDSIYLPDPNADMYLEMEYRTDFDFSVGFSNPNMTGGSVITESAMVLYKTDEWKKIYINMGRLWTYYRHYPYIRLFFTVLNSDGEEGNVYLDNMKLLYFIR